MISNQQEVFSFTSYNKNLVLELRTNVQISVPNKSFTKGHIFSAIWDTGATGCSITKKVADSIGIHPISVVTVAGVHGFKKTYSYFVNILLPNNVCIPQVEVTEIDESAGCDVLIGMKIITMGDFCVTNFEGKTTFSFRIPSLMKVDYTAISNQKIKRNDLCPCGSGLKFKKCCGKNLKPI